MSGAAFDVIVLAGGAASRLGGTDKLALDLGGRPLLDHVLAACRGATRVVAVGPTRAVQPYGDGSRGPSYELVWCREDPPGGGPLAALAAAVPALVSPITVVVGGDMPFVGPLVDRLVATIAAGAAAAACPDEAGRALPLPSAFERAVLAGQVTEIGPPQGVALRRLLDGLAIALVAARGEADDVDTPAQLAAARARLTAAATSPGRPG